MNALSSASFAGLSFPSPENPKWQAMDIPSWNDQKAYWDTWNLEHRVSDFDAFMPRLRDGALKYLPPNPGRILEVGCGTGWLLNTVSHAGRCTGVDLAEKSIEVARTRYPHIEFRAGDFAQMQFEGRFGYVV